MEIIYVIMNQIHLLDFLFYNYIIIADGWNNDAPGYFNFSETNSKNAYGVKYVIK